MAKPIYKKTKLFELPNPLSKRLGAQFFSTLPKEMGLYFFEGKKGELLYVGSSSDISKKIKKYQLVCPLELNSKQRRLVYSTQKISWEICKNTQELKDKKALILEPLTKHKTQKKIKASRSAYQYLNLIYRPHNKRLHFKLMKKSEVDGSEDKKIFGPFTITAAFKKNYSALLRVLAFMAEIETGKLNFTQLDPELTLTTPPLIYQVRCSAILAEKVVAFFNGNRGTVFIEDCLQSIIKVKNKISRYYREVLKNDFNVLIKFYEQYLSYETKLKGIGNIGKTQSLERLKKRKAILKLTNTI
jgi:hypothetical protein